MSYYTKKPQDGRYMCTTAKRAHACFALTIIRTNWLLCIVGTLNPEEVPLCGNVTGLDTDAQNSVCGWMDLELIVAVFVHVLCCVGYCLLNLVNPTSQGPEIVFITPRKTEVCNLIYGTSIFLDLTKTPNCTRSASLFILT